MIFFFFFFAFLPLTYPKAYLFSMLEIALFAYSEHNP